MSENEHSNIQKIKTDCTQSLNTDDKSEVLDKLAEKQKFDAQIIANIHSELLPTWLLLNGQQINTLDQLFKTSLWNGICKSDYPNVTRYLKNVEITSKSFDLLLPDFVNDNKSY